MLTGEYTRRDAFTRVIALLVHTRAALARAADSRSVCTRANPQWIGSKSSELQIRPCDWIGISEDLLPVHCGFSGVLSTYVQFAGKGIMCRGERLPMSHEGFCSTISSWVRTGPVLRQILEWLVPYCSARDMCCRGFHVNVGFHRTCINAQVWKHARACRPFCMMHVLNVHLHTM